MSRLRETERSRRLRGFALVLAVITLVGCANVTATPTSVPATVQPRDPTPTPSPTPTPEPTPLISTLELWLPEELDPYGERVGSEVLASQLSEFNRTHSNVQVEVVVKKAHGRGGLVDFMRTARDAAPSVLPDLVVLDASDLDTVARADLVQPFDALTAWTAPNDYFPFASTMGKAEGRTVGAILGVDMQHLAYRPTLFDSAPLTWTQVISAQIPFLFPAGGIDGQVNDATLIQYLGAGGRLTDDEGSPSLNEEAMIDVFTFYTECITHTVISPMELLTLTHVDQAWEQFKAGEGGMTAVRARRYWTEGDETMAAAPIPTKDGQPISIARGWALAVVTEDPARQDLAMLLVEWLMAPDHSALWTQAAGYLPPTHDVLELWAVTEEERIVLRDLLEAAVPAPRPTVKKATGPPMQLALESVLSGRATPEEAAASAIESLRR